MNALRAHLAELGIIAARGLPSVAALMTIVREGEDTRLPAAARFALMAVADQIDTLADQIFKLERAIVTEAKRCDHKGSASGSRRIQIGAPLRRLGGIDTEAPFQRRQGTTRRDL